MREGWRRQGPRSSTPLRGRSCHTQELALNYALSVDRAPTSSAAKTGDHDPPLSDLHDEAGQEFVCLYRRRNFYAVCRFELPRSFCHQFGTSHKRKLSSTRSRGDRILAQPRRAIRAYASCENCPSCHCAAGRRYCSKPQISSIFRVSRLHKRGVSRSSRTLGAGCGGRFGCALTNAAEADGEIVWSWRPDAGAKFSRDTIPRK